MSKRKLRLDLHPIYNRGDRMTPRLRTRRRRPNGAEPAELEIISGKAAAR